MQYLIEDVLAFIKGDFQKVNVIIDSVEGSIQKIAKSISPTERTNLDRILKYPRNSMLLPGMIDIHVHFRDLNQKHKETIESGSKAAAAGGVTTAFDMPNKNPPTTNKERLEKLKQLITRTAIIDVFPYLQLTSENANTLEQHPWIKIFLGRTFEAREIDEDVMYRAFQTAIFNISEGHPSRTIFSIHCEDPQLLQEEVKPTNLSWDEFLKSNPQVVNKWRPKEAEARAIEKIMHLIKRLNLPNQDNIDFQQLKIHVAHLSTKEGLEQFIQLQKSLNISSVTLSSEVTPHHLWFTHDDLKKLGVLGKVNPPLRTKKDVFALRQALRQGLISIIATDHAPHLLQEKFDIAPSGMPGIETALPVLVTLYRKGIITMHQIVSYYSKNPAKLMGIDEKGYGSINIGNPANLVVINPKEEWKVKNDDIHSKCGWTPFDGEILYGRPIHTFHQGKIVFERECKH